MRELYVCINAASGKALLREGILDVAVFPAQPHPASCLPFSGLKNKISQTLEIC